MSKILSFGSEGRKNLEIGINILADAVRITLGPRGRNVLIEKSYGPPLITNDGATIAKEIELEDKFQNMGAALLKEVAMKANDVAGDGTTTAIVLAHGIAKEGLKMVTSGVNPIFLKKGIELGVKEAVKQLNLMSKKIESNSEIESVANISAGDSEIGKLIAQAMSKVGEQGVITVEAAQSLETTLEIVEGMEIEKGYISPYMANDNERMVSELEEAYILLTDRKISSMKEILHLLEEVVKKSAPILIICEDLEGEALTTLVVNKLRGTINAVAVKAPAFGERRKALLEDIAVLTGATPVFSQLGTILESCSGEILGKARKIKITNSSTVIVGGYGDREKIENRKARIKNEINESKSEYDIEKLKERFSKLSGGVAQISVGAATEIELKEKKLRIEDALNATSAAIEEGIVPGGGVALLQIAKKMEDFTEDGEIGIGVEIVKKVLLSPIKQISENAGINGSVVIERLNSYPMGYGYDAAKEEYRDMLEAGIIDPVKVTRSALQNAASVAGLILTTEVLIVNKKIESTT
ncbi:MAG: chaperonin GroEL [Fusobacteriaceae bacterium]